MNISCFKSLIFGKNKKVDKLSSSNKEIMRKKRKESEKLERQYVRDSFTIITIEISLNNINSFKQPVCDISFNNVLENHDHSYDHLKRKYSFFNCHVTPVRINEREIHFKYSFPFYNRTIRDENNFVFFPDIQIFDTEDPFDKRVCLRDILDLNKPDFVKGDFLFKITEDPTLIEPLLIDYIRKSKRPIPYHEPDILNNNVYIWPEVSE